MSVMKLLSAGLIVAAAAAAASSSQVTFNKDVLPIMQQKCQNCHRTGEVAPMSFLTYESTRPWAKAVKTAVASRKMPPWFADPRYGHFKNDMSLTQSQIDTIVKWVDAGAPEGKAKDAPPPVKWPEGWTIKPDVVVSMPPYQVPAKGVLEWTYITIPSGFTKDTWITSIEIRPGDPSVVHHVVFYIKPHTPDTVYNRPIWYDTPRDEKGVALKDAPRGTKRQLVDADGNIVTMTNTELTGGGTLEALYVPGIPPMDFRIHNAAKLVPAGADLVVQMHYTPNGKAVTDVTKFGFTVAKEEPQRKVVTFVQQPAEIGDREKFHIPPGDGNWASPPLDLTFLEDVEMTWLMPHMHLRGKDMTYTLTYPTGESQIILNVPHYNFEWQLGYDLEKPLMVPKGSKFHADAHYDNSVNNPFNPDPTQDVYGGEQTFEEMMVPWFNVIVPRDVDPKKIVKGKISRGGA